MQIDGSVALVTGADRGRQPAGEQRGGDGGQHVHQRAEPGRCPARDGDQLLRHAEHVPGLRAGARGQRRRRAGQHALGHSFYTNPFDASYGASKAAAWSLTNGVRIELAHQGTLVVAVHASFIDTGMAAGIDAPKVSPESVARQVFDAVGAGQVEVLADERSRFVQASLSRDHELIYPPIQAFWDAALKGTP
jgi:hypothetical protein